VVHLTRNFSRPHALVRQDRPFLSVHFVTEARALPQMPHAGCPALGKELCIGLGREVPLRLAVGEGHAQEVFDQVHVIHPDRIVVGEEGTDLDTDVAADALLEAILHGLYASARQRVRGERLDALHGAELRTFATGKAEVHVHEGDCAGAFLLFSDLVRDLRDAVFLEPTLDDVDCRHELFS
jgi:hypothetical protein